MGAEGSMNYVVEKLREMERVTGAENWTNYALEKLKEMEGEMGPEEKLKEWLVVLENFGGSLIGKVDEVFPPETRVEQLKHWLQVAAPFIIAAVVLLVCLRCCCCGRGGGRAVKMMKAPGRPFRIPRAGFEASPRSYFRGLRGK